MDFLREVIGFFLFAGVEGALVHAVGHNRAAQLSAGELVQDQTFFAGVDDGAVIKRFIFLCQFGLVGQCLQGLQDLFIHLFGCVVIGQTRGHGNPVFSDAICPAFAGHGFLKVYMPFEFAKALIGCD